MFLRALVIGLLISMANGVAAAETPPAPIPVLCYHRFGAYPPKDPYFVSLDEFKRQLAIIHAEGFSPISAADLEAGWEGRKPLPPKPLLITVDDGYADFWSQARPLLQGYGYTATLFVYVTFIGSKHGLTVEQLRALQAEGFEIGSHSYTHPKLTRPTRIELQQGQEAFWQRELKGSRAKLEGWLGNSVTALAYPYGLWNQAVADVATAAGYRLLFTVDQGTNDRATPREQLKRIMILHGTTDKTFRALLHDWPLTLPERSVQPGQAVAGPLKFITATLSPESRRQIDPATLHAQKGGTPLAVRYQAETGQVTMTFPEPWCKGTNIMMLTAEDKSHKRRYKESWLVTVQATTASE